MGEGEKEMVILQSTLFGLVKIQFFLGRSVDWESAFVFADFREELYAEEVC